MAIYVHSVKPLSPAARQKLEDVNEKLGRFFRSIISASWVFVQEHGNWEVRCQLHGRSGRYRVVVEATTARDAIDAAYEKLVRQRRRARRKAISKRRGQSTNEP